ncbi:MAG TPA: hypothetical protein VN682_20580 [Terriglobales bacterium]|nr:hypothetical protein [Terriglobales bacterium]
MATLGPQDLPTMALDERSSDSFIQLAQRSTEIQRQRMTAFPDNKRFAFSIFDDTDLSTVENVGPVYKLLDEIGIRTTKSVWPLASSSNGRFGGASLQDPDYLKFVLGLKESGFEIALHNVRNMCSTREQVQAGLEEFRRLLGFYPRVHANHSHNRENIYWGPARFSRIARLYRAMTMFRRLSFEGHIQESKYFWGDLCRAHFDYVRNFVFREINLNRVNPTMPYHDPERPFVNAWFSSSDGHDVQAFCELLREVNQDRLEEEQGVCIVYTHFACGFVSMGAVHPRVDFLLRRLARKDGWFTPVSTLLDFLRKRPLVKVISITERSALERRWLSDRLVDVVFRGIRKPSPHVEPATRRRHL